MKTTATTPNPFKELNDTILAFEKDLKKVGRGEVAEALSKARPVKDIGSAAHAEVILYGAQAATTDSQGVWRVGYVISPGLGRLAAAARLARNEGENPRFICNAVKLAADLLSGKTTTFTSKKAAADHERSFNAEQERYRLHGPAKFSDITSGRLGRQNRAARKGR